MKRVSLVLLAVLLMLTSSLAACTSTKQVLVSDGYSEYIYDESGIAETDDKDTTDKTTSNKVNSTNKDNTTDTSSKKTDDKTNDTSSKKTDEGKDNDKTTTVTVAFNSFRPTDIEPMLTEFKKLYPNIKIKVDYYNSSSDNSKEYIANKSAAGKLPDVVFDDIAQLSLYVSQGIVYPLTKFVKNDKEFDYIPDYFVENYTYGGDLYALPHQAYFTSIVFNLDLMDSLNLDMPELDWTVEDFIALCKKAYTKNNYAIDDDNFFESYFAPLYASGASNYGYIEKTRSFDINALVKSLQLQAELRSISGLVGFKSRFGASGEKSDYYKLTGSEDTFAAMKNGKSLMLDLQRGTYNYSFVEELCEGFDWCFWPYPQNASSPGRMPVHVDHAWMTTAAKNPDAAFTVLRYLTYSKEGNLARLNAYINADSGKYKLNLPYYTPTTLQPDVKAAYTKLMKQNSGNSHTFETALYQYENLEKCFRGDCDKYTPSFSQSWLDNATVTVNKMRDSGDYSGAAALQKKATKAIQDYWKDFETKLAKVKKDNKELY